MITSFSTGSASKTLGFFKNKTHIIAEIKQDKIRKEKELREAQIRRENRYSTN